MSKAAHDTQDTMWLRYVHLILSIGFLRILIFSKLHEMLNRTVFKKNVKLLLQMYFSL